MWNIEINDLLAKIKMELQVTNLSIESTFR